VNKVNKKQKQDIELGIATAITLAYMSILTYALLAENHALALWDTAVFICLLYICKQADRQEKARLRRRKAQREALTQALDELEQWREQREAD
jgi:small-conductance mechanosensitive channel